jgi:hypothetical protein
MPINAEEEQKTELLAHDTLNRILRGECSLVFQGNADIAMLQAFGWMAILAKGFSIRLSRPGE